MPSSRPTLLQSKEFFDIFKAQYSMEYIFEKDHQSLPLIQMQTGPRIWMIVNLQVAIVYTLDLTPFYGVPKSSLLLPGQVQSLIQVTNSYGCRTCMDKDAS